MICVLDVALNYKFSCLRELKLILVSPVTTAVKTPYTGHRARVYIYAAILLLVGTSHHLFALGKPFYILMVVSLVLSSTEGAKMAASTPSSHVFLLSNGH